MRMHLGPPSNLPPRLAKTRTLPTYDIRSFTIMPLPWMEDLRRSTPVEAWMQEYPNLYYETAMLVAAVYPPAKPVRLRDEEHPETYVLPVYFELRAAYAVAYSCKHYYNLNPETMVAFALTSRQSHHAVLLRRLSSGLADVVGVAYDQFVEARPCRRSTTPHSGRPTSP